jgi:hypothetical protein
LPAAWLLCDESSFAFHGYCQNAYGFDIATENRPISHLATVIYKVYPLFSQTYRGPTPYGRNVAMYLMRYLRGDTLSTICKEFGLKKDSSAGSIVDRVKKQILKDKQFRNKVARIKKITNKS